MVLCFNFDGLGVIACRLRLQVFDDLVVTHLARDLQTEFCLGAKVLRVTHALLPGFFVFVTARGELIAAQLHLSLCGADRLGILKAYDL
jgi:hypothetical protein